jgi:hypothetical protein
VDEAKYTQWFAEYTIANFTLTALQYSGEDVEVRASSMLIGAASCTGLKEYGGNDVITCPGGLALGTFSMPLDGSTRFVRNLDWAVVDREVVMFGGMSGQGATMKVRCVGYTPCTLRSSAACIVGASGDALLPAQELLKLCTPAVEHSVDVTSDVCASRLRALCCHAHLCPVRDGVPVVELTLRFGAML